MEKLKLSNKREAFTLVEVLAVVVILGILTLITYPILNGIIDKNKQKLYDEQMENLMIGSRTWIVQNGGKLQRVHGYIYRLSFEEMYKSGMIDSMNPKNPKTGRDLTGCMQLLYRRDIEGFDITYDESCDGTLGPVVIDEPKVDLTVEAGIINSNGWAKEDFYVKVVGEYLVNHTYCVDKEECTPYITGKGNSNNILINTEGTTYVCINGTNELETTDTVCKSYKLDKTNPIVGKIVLSGTSGLNDWFVSDVSVSYTASTDVLSGIDTNVLSPSETVITTDTEGTTYTLTATDKAGNTSSTSYTVKVDKTGPNVGSLTFDGTLVEGWYTSDVTVNIVNGTDDMSGHLVTTSDVAKVTENTDNKVITVTSYDNAGNTSSNTYTIKVDKTGPAILDKYVAYNLYPTNAQTGVNELTISNNLFSTTGTDGYMYYTGLKLTDTSKVIISLGTPLDSDTTFQVYYLTSGLTFTDANSVKYQAKKGETHIELDLPGLDYDTIRIDFGEESNKTYNVSSIDIVTSKYISDESYIHANIKDELSGVKSYDVNSTGWKDIEVSPTYHMRYEVTIAGTYTINVKDKAGNTNSEVVNNNNADITAPTKPTIDYNGSWINTNLKIKLSTTEEESGVSHWRYSLDGQVYNNYENSSSLTFETPEFETEGEYEVFFMACDTAGNCSEPNSTYIRLDKTKPVIGEFVINGEAGLNGWYVSDVEVTVTDSYDDLSQIDTVTLTPNDTTITEDTEGITYTLTATDKAGNSVTYDHIVKVDKTDPTAGTATFEGTKGNDDWYTGDVTTILTNGSDETSGHLSTTIDFETINFDTQGQVVTVKTLDNAGNESTREYTIKRDASGPILGQLEFTGVLGLNDWYVSDVEVGYATITDPTSGVATETLSPNSKLTVDTDGITYTLTATDNAGNTSSVSQTIKRDTEKPSLGEVTINGTKGSNDWYTSDVTFSLTDGTDTLSGFFMNVIDIDQLTENTDGTLVTYVALDNAGNENSQEYVIKIDKTTPTPGTFEIVGTMGSEGWYVSDVTISGTGGSDDIAGPVTTTVDISKITSNTNGTTITLTTTNAAGLTATDTTTIKVDKTAPTGSIVATSTDPYTIDVTASVEDPNSGIKEYGYLLSETEACPVNGYTNSSNNTYQFTGLTPEKEYYVCVKVVDKALNTDYIASNKVKVENNIPVGPSIVAKLNNASGTTYNQDWTNQNVYLEFSPNLNTDTVTSYEYQYDGTNGTWLTAGVTVSNNKGNMLVSGDKEGTLYVRGCNKRGCGEANSIEIKVDQTDPKIGTIQFVGTTGLNDWYVSSVDVSYIASTDDLSGIKTESMSPSAGTINYDTKGITYTLTATDKAGNTASASATIKVDVTKPTAGTLNISGTKGSNDWYTGDVTFTINNGSDATSDHLTTVSSLSSITSNTSGTTVTVTTTDKAGNTSTRDYTVKVDKSKPTLTAKTGPFEIVEGDSVDVKSYFNTPSYGISKEQSYTCNITNTSSLDVGTHTINCTATSKNGLSTTAGINLTVKPDTFMTVDNSNANAPVLFTNMIPVVYDGSNWIYSDGTQVNWYNYSTQQWANAVILKASPSKSYSVGDSIDMSDMAQMYVWIPRYKYTIFNGNNGSVSEQLINVEFEPGTATTGTVKCYDAVSGSGTSSEVCSDSKNGSIVNGTSTYTHPAFCFGRKNTDGSCNGTELTGIWVGKFEVSGTASAANLTVLPNKNPLVSTSISAYFTAMSGVSSSFNINNTNNKPADSHMMKNMEWGAVAYLKQSSYGLGTTDVALNNYYDESKSVYYMTGCGSAVGTTATTTTCTPYNEANGQAASTTGNIYGVYDMSGGAWECVMGNMVKSSGEFHVGSAGIFSPDAKYYDAYTYNTSYTTHGRGKLGDATKETLKTFGNTSGGWYSDIAHFPSSASSWFIRGGLSDYGSFAGVFNFDSGNGGGSDSYSARLVITEPSITNSVYLSVVNGTGSSYKEVTTGGSAAWTITANDGYTTTGATFSPSGCGTINGNTVTISNVQSPHTCTVTLAEDILCAVGTAFGQCLYNNASKSGLDTNNYSGMYRYIGTTANNFVTFAGEKAGYRVIGVTSSANSTLGTSQYQVKLIKADNYANDGNTLGTGKVSWPWHTSDTTNTTWENSYLNKTVLNGSSSLSYLYTISSYSSKIASVKWYQGDVKISNDADGGSKLFGYEDNAVTSSKYKIGIMYASEYYYSAQGGGSVNCYRNKTECPSWMFGVTGSWNVVAGTWNLTRWGGTNLGSGTQYFATFLEPQKPYISDNLVSMHGMVRPTFYLNTTVTYQGGSGTIDDPFIIN